MGEQTGECEREGFRRDGQVLKKSGAGTVLDDGDILVGQVFPKDGKVPFGGGDEEVKFPTKPDLFRFAQAVAKVPVESRKSGTHAGSGAAQQVIGHLVGVAGDGNAGGKFEVAEHLDAAMDDVILPRRRHFVDGRLHGGPVKHLERAFSPDEQP